MAKLGEAYVSINADWSKLEGQVDRGLKSLTQKFEKSVNKDFGKRLGTDLGAGIREGVESGTSRIGGLIDRGGSDARRRGRGIGRQVSEGIGDGLSALGPIRKGLASMVSALEDGFSSLPPEIKAAVGAAIVAAIIPVGGLIAGALAGALIAGTAGLGALLAFQLEEAQLRGQKFLDKLRDRFVNNAAVFLTPLDEAFDLLEYRIALLDPTIKSLFDSASDYIVPLADGLSALIGESLRGLERGLSGADFEGFSDALISGFTELGTAIGDVFEQVLVNPNSAQSLKDLIVLTADLTYAVGDLLDTFLDLWPTVKTVLTDIGNGTQALLDTLNLFWTAATLGMFDLEGAWNDFGDSWSTFFSDFDGETTILAKKIDQIASSDTIRQKVMKGTISLTDDEAKAVKELNKQLKDQLDLVNDLISTNVDYEASIDDTIEALKESKGSIDTREEAGRNAVTAIQREINALKERVNVQLATGQMTEDQAKKFYDKEIARLEAEFRKRGGNIKQFEEIFGWLIKLQNFPALPDKFGPWRISLQDSQTVLAAVLRAAQTLAKLPAPKLPTRSSGSSSGPQAYAEGGLITEPTLAMMGENYRPEMVLPLTDPARSMQLLASSPLAGMMNGQVINVYVGNEQLKSTMYRVARGVSSSNARTLSQNPRTI